MKRALVALALAAAAIAGCAKGADADRRGDCACAGEAVVDPALLAFLSKARAAHHKADLAEDRGDRAAAAAALAALADGPRPQGQRGALPPEAAEVLADTLARLADLRSQAGDAQAATRDVEEGLALATAPTHFRGHLFEVLGIVRERQAKAMEAAGDKPSAERMKAQAVQAFETAIKIQDQVIDEALKGRDGGIRDGG